MAKRVSVINFKGGVGKTTLSFHLATGLAELGKKVLLVDVDHQSTLSVLCQGVAIWQGSSEENRTVNAVFRSFVANGAPFPGSEIIARSPITKRYPRHGLWHYESPYPGVDLAPASLSLDDTEIELTGTYKADGNLSEWRKRTLLCRWLEESAIDGVSLDSHYDYIIFDCPPATKIVSQNAIAASQGYIIPVIPEAVMIRGIAHLRSLIGYGIDGRLSNLAQSDEPRSVYADRTQLLGVVITSIKTHGPAHSGYVDDHDQHRRLLERELGNLLVRPYIEEGVGVPQSLARNLPVFACVDNRNVRNRGFIDLYRSLVSNLKERIDAL